MLTEAQQRLLIDDTVGVMDEESIGAAAAARLMLSRIEAGGNWNGLIGYATLLETQARVRALRRAKQREKQKS